MVKAMDKDKTEWVRYPVCGNKTRSKYGQIQS